MSVQLLDAYPAKACSKPGGQATICCEVWNKGNPQPGILGGKLWDPAEPFLTERNVEIDIPAGASIQHLSLPLPTNDARGYFAILTLELQGATPLETSTSVLVLSHWSLAPRYGFLSDFPPTEAGLDRIAELAKFQLTIIQFYDWMYRHYHFLPPQDTFRDSMGRQLSLRTVRNRIAACQDFGMATLAYGAIYGAEAEFAEQHPSWILRDSKDNLLSLIDRFFITDIRKESKWREKILQEYEIAVGRLGFDGIHMDQYGTPKRAYDVNGTAIDLAEHLPSLINEAASRIKVARDGAAVLFNAVNNWPIQQIADTRQAAVYIEVWPPHTSYRDLVDLITRARDLSGKQVVLAAYLEPYRKGGAAAEVCAKLITAVIASAGGHHLLLGEGDAVLRDPYYPNHGHLHPEFKPIMRRYYNHTAALHHYLFSRDLIDVSGPYTSSENAEVTLKGTAVSIHPEAGRVWLTIKRRNHQWILNLVNLVGISSSNWNEGKNPPTPIEGLELKLGPFVRVDGITWASPDSRESPLILVPAVKEDGSVRLKLPLLQLWATIVIRGK